MIMTIGNALLDPSTLCSHQLFHGLENTNSCNQNSLNTIARTKATPMMTTRMICNLEILLLVLKNARI